MNIFEKILDNIASFIQEHISIWHFINVLALSLLYVTHQVENNQILLWLVLMPIAVLSAVKCMAYAIGDYEPSKRDVLAALVIVLIPAICLFVLTLIRLDLYLFLSARACAEPYFSAGVRILSICQPADPARYFQAYGLFAITIFVFTFLLSKHDGIKYAYKSKCSPIASSIVIVVNLLFVSYLAIDSEHLIRDIHEIFPQLELGDVVHAIDNKNEATLYTNVSLNKVILFEFTSLLLMAMVVAFTWRCLGRPARPSEAE